jgi:hypothetical protein
MVDDNSSDLQKPAVVGSDRDERADVPISKQAAGEKQDPAIEPERRSKAGGPRRGAGRKKVQIELADLEKLCSLDCSDQEIADFFGVNTRTLERRRRDEPEFAMVMRRGRASVKVRVRRAQMKHLEAGNVAMAIHLGKTLLGQRSVTELSGPQGQPIQISLEAFDAVLNQARKNKPNS